MSSIVRLRVEHMAGGTRGAHLPQQSLHRTAALEPPLYWYYENTTSPPPISAARGYIHAELTTEATTFYGSFMWHARQASGLARGRLQSR